MCVCVVCVCVCVREREREQRAALYAELVVPALQHLGTQFTCFTSTKVQTLMQRALTQVSNALLCTPNFTPNFFSLISR